MEGIARLQDGAPGMNMISEIASITFDDAICPEEPSTVRSPITIEKNRGKEQVRRRVSTPNLHRSQAPNARKIQTCKYCGKFTKQMEVHLVLHHFKERLFQIAKSRTICIYCNELYRDENEFALHLAFLHINVNTLESFASESTSSSPAPGVKNPSNPQPFTSTPKRIITIKKTNVLLPNSAVEPNTPIKSSESFKTQETPIQKQTQPIKQTAPSIKEKTEDILEDAIVQDAITAAPAMKSATKADVSKVLKSVNMKAKLDAKKIGTPKRRAPIKEVWVKKADVSKNVEPEKNAEPAKNTEPAKNAEPARKSEPAKKTEPTKKAEPVMNTERSKKTEPAKKTEPTKKAEPAMNAEPAKKTGPVKKTDPTTKTGPVKKTDPTKKTESAKKAEPEKKAESAKKAEPEKKTEPVKKTEPARKAEPVKKTEPTQKPESIRKVKPVKVNETVKKIDRKVGCGVCVKCKLPDCGNCVVCQVNI